MAYFDYNYNDYALILNFMCHQCNQIIESESLSIPQPDLLAENHSESVNKYRMS